MLFQRGVAWVLAPLLVLWVPPAAGRGWGGHSHGHGGRLGWGNHGSIPTVRIPAAVGGGYSWYGPPYYMTVGPNGPFAFGPSPPTMMLTPVPVPFVAIDRGPLGGPMPAGGMPQLQEAPVARREPRRNDP